MGKQSTLGKFWGKPPASADSTKKDEEKKKENTSDMSVTSRDAGNAGVDKATSPDSAGGKNKARSSSQYPTASRDVKIYQLISSLNPIGNKATKEGKAEFTKKRRVVESDDEDGNDGDADMKTASETEQAPPTKTADQPAPEPPKKRAKKDSDADTDEASTVQEIRQEVKETAKAQINQIKEAPETNGTATSTSKPASKPASTSDSGKGSKVELKQATGENPFSLAKAKTLNAKTESTTGKSVAIETTRQVKGKGKPDPDESEDDAKPSDKNYQPGEEEDEHDSDHDAEVSEKDDDEPEEEEEDADDQEEEKSAKVAASKLYVFASFLIP